MTPSYVKLEAAWVCGECAARDCSVTFVPATTTQRFDSDACRKRTHRRAKAAVSAAMSRRIDVKLSRGSSRSQRKSHPQRRPPLLRTYVPLRLLSAQLS